MIGCLFLPRGGICVHDISPFIRPHRLPIRHELHWRTPTLVLPPFTPMLVIFALAFLGHDTLPHDFSVAPRLISDTPRCGNISRQFVVISALKKGLSFTTFGKKECFKM